MNLAQDKVDKRFLWNTKIV